MLKRLELVGFKSFADKTRLEFDPGISAIVGPNGSGKSNIVDAIRWILGEQSAKSLRGKEMADCIFNGSGTRRSHGMAEVSLFLDNTKRFLPVDDDEVVLTRRVYRSGEGEYLINGQVARLRDIKDLFLGTGAGHHAYSIIEQGKVDMILQASTKDRRFIFEEAAGISRYKARKIEALRRLERVAQNLVRVHDIKEEVDRQLRSLRQQAGKARRYRELSERYRQLRLRHGAQDYRRLTEQLTQIRERTQPVETRLAESRARVDRLEPELRTIEEAIGRLEEETRQFAARLATLRQSSAALEPEIANDHAREVELAEEFITSLGRLAVGQSRAKQLETELAEARRRAEEALAERESHASAMRASEQTYQRLSTEIDELRRSADEVGNSVKSLLSDLARLENEQSALDGQLSLLWQQRDRLLRQTADSIAARDLERRTEASLHEQDVAVRLQLGAFLHQSSRTESEHRQLLRQRTELLESLARVREERIAAHSRMDVLRQLRQRHEGLDAGVKQVLAERTEGEPAWQPVLGVLAEQMEVDADTADLVELALGARAQSLVVPSLTDLSEGLLGRARRLPGRVHFLAIEDPQGDRLVVLDDQIPWPTLASLVRCSPTIRPLVDRLLGQTYLADDFATARRMSRRSMDLRFITPDGDILELDGSVATGPTHKTAGILARSAELRILEEKEAESGGRIETLEAELAALDTEIRRLEDVIGEREVRRSTLAEQSRHIDLLLRQGHDRLAHHETQIAAQQVELSRTLDEIRETSEQSLELERMLAAAHEGIHSTTQQEKELTAAIEENVSQYNQLTGRINEARTQRAVVEERLAGLRAEEQKLVGELEGRRLEIDALAGRVQLAVNRRREIQLRLLANRSQAAHLFALMDQVAAERGDRPEEMARRREERRRFGEELGTLRRSVAEDQESLHRDEILVTELRLKRDTLAGRIQEDYGADLATLDLSGDEEIELSDEEMAREIEDLREKLARLGSVSSEAVAELEDLEQRAATFELQINDLNVAQKHLEQLIGRINEECRRLFIDSFETIRLHFQELFRKLFGGGRADVLLEDETDVLESGIEIIARPPGKEPQSISLLSGGEKTLTAAALVMAIFRSKPSPFCILDEVDAALDEANIGRFVQLLRDYTSLSQFILITHSKTTMAAADVLHGITQRESGVSIRVSVRLEDVTHDGNIIDREEDTSDSAA